MSPLTERKGTGFVGDNTDASGQPENNSENRPGSSSQLEQLDEEMETVEEESLVDSDSEHASVHSGRSFHDQSPGLVASKA